MKKNKILILNLAVRGGGANYAREIIIRLNLDSYIISAKHSEIEKLKADEYWKTHSNLKQLIIYTFFYLPFFTIKIIKGVISGKYKSLYLPNFHFWNIIFIMIFRIFRKEVIVTVHDGSLHKKNGYPIIQILANGCIKRASKLIFLTEYVKEETLKTLQLQKSEFYIISHGIITPKFINSSARIFRNNPSLLFFGRVLRSKGVNELLEAVSKIDGSLYNKLYIVGKPNYKINLDKPVKTEIVDEFIPEDEIANYFNICDILILPYQEASQSGVLTIGIGAAIPMVVTKGSGLSEQLNENEAVFVEKDIESIKNGILKLINNPALYNTISENLVRKQKELNWDIISQQVEKIIG